MSTTTEKKAPSKIQKTKKTLQWFQKRAKMNIKKAPVDVNFELTFNLRRVLRGTTLKTRAPRAMREIKKYVRKSMGTSDVRLDPSLNKFVWSNGIKAIPPKVRLIITRKKNEDDSKLKKPFCTVNALVVPSFKNLKSKRLEAQ